MSKLSLIKNFNYNFMGILISNISFSIGISLVSRKLGPVRFGEVNSFMAIIAIFIPLISYGASNYFTREYAVNPNDTTHTDKFFKYTVSVSLLLSVIICLLLTVTNYYTFSKFSQIFYVLAILFSQATDLQWLYRSKENTKIIAQVLSITAMLNLLLLILLYKVLTIELFLMITSICKALNVIFFYLFDKNLNFMKSVNNLVFMRRNVETKVDVKAFKVIFLLSLSGLLNLIYVKADLIILSIYKFKLEAGLYASAYTILSLLLLFRGTLLSIFIPSLVRNFHDDLKQYKYSLGIYLKLGSILGVASSSLVCLLSAIIVKVMFGEGFLEAIPVINLLMLVNAVVFLNMGISSSLIAIKKDKQFTLITLVAALINILGNFIFVPYYDMYAAAITTFISEVFVLSFAMHILNRENKLNYTKIFFRSSTKIVVSTIIILGISYFMKVILNLYFNLYLAEILSSILFIVLFLLNFRVFKLIKKEEIMLLVKVRK
ncbi:polysaccharide biosynthesis C-terminal domain-containing protein [Priestia megaterium]|uniref:oligosaccharide flippase family protein n=1 Tax=Priestia megaterium TaxID=1404 RepID=UPI00119E1165|nr:polysaccharide biosynthesis C-terminal domain-containing protein [Priestia megaterium]